MARDKAITVVGSGSGLGGRYQQLLVLLEGLPDSGDGLRLHITWLRRLVRMYAQNPNQLIALLSKISDAERKITDFIDWLSSVDLRIDEMLNREKRSAIAFLQLTLLYQHLVTTPYLVNRGVGSSRNFIYFASQVFWSDIKIEWLSRDKWKLLLNKLVAMLSYDEHFSLALQILIALLRRKDLIATDFLNDFIKNIVAKLRPEMLLDVKTAETIQNFLGEPRFIISLITNIPNVAPELVRDDSTTAKLLQLACAKSVASDWEIFFRKSFTLTSCEIANIITYLAMGFLGDVVSVDFFEPLAFLNQALSDESKARHVYSIIYERSSRDNYLFKGLQQLLLQLSNSLPFVQQLVMQIVADDEELSCGDAVSTVGSLSSEPEVVQDDESVDVDEDDEVLPAVVEDGDEVLTESSSDDEYFLIRQLIINCLLVKVDAGASFSGRRELIAKLGEVESYSVLLQIIWQLASENRDYSYFIWNLLGGNRNALKKWFKHFSTNDFERLESELLDILETRVVAALNSKYKPELKSNLREVCQALHWISCEGDWNALLTRLSRKGSKARNFLLRVVTAKSPNLPAIKKLFPQLNYQSREKIWLQLIGAKIAGLLHNYNDETGENIAKIIFEIESLRQFFKIVRDIYEVNSFTAKALIAVVEKLCKSKGGFSKVFPKLSDIEIKALELGAARPKGGILVWVLLQPVTGKNLVPVSTDLTESSTDLATVDSSEAKVRSVDIDSESPAQAIDWDVTWINKARGFIAHKKWSEAVEMVFDELYFQSQNFSKYQGEKFMRALLKLLPTVKQRYMFLSVLYVYVQSFECGEKYLQFDIKSKPRNIITKLILGTVDKFVSIWVEELKESHADLAEKDIEALFFYYEDEYTLIPEESRKALRMAVFKNYVALHPYFDVASLKALDSEEFAYYQQSIEKYLLNMSASFVKLSQGLWQQELAKSRGDDEIVLVKEPDRLAALANLATALDVAYNLIASSDNHLLTSLESIYTLVDKVAESSCRYGGYSVDTRICNKLADLCGVILGNNKIVSQLSKAERDRLIHIEYQYSSGKWYERNMLYGWRKLRWLVFYKDQSGEPSIVTSTTEEESNGISSSPSFFFQLAREDVASRGLTELSSRVAR